jgi:potassium-dependent mechanosensitive channel
MLEIVTDWLIWARDLALGWLLSPAAWSQFALLVVAWGLAVVIARIAGPRISALLAPAEDSQTLLARARRFLLVFLPLLLPLIAYGLTAAGEQTTRALFGAGEVIGFGKRLFLLIAARILVRDILSDGFLRFLGRFVLLPIAALYTLGLLDDVTAFLTAFTIQLGNISFSAMALVRGVIAGALLFWLGMWANDQSSNYIGRQPMRPPIRQLSLKAAEFVIFGVAFLLLMNIMGISLSSLAILGGAIGVGLGFGLQKIASNFISGVILLLEGQTTVGDMVRLNGGEQGRVIKMTARATILEAEDGSWIVVPNEDFIVTRVINFSDSGENRQHQARFAVPHGTDLAQVPGIAAGAVAALPGVLGGDLAPVCELRGFAEGGADFAVEFSTRGDEGGSRLTSDALFAVWTALRGAGIAVIGTPATRGAA